MSTTTKINFDHLISALVRVNNSTDADRDYAIEASVVVNGESAESFDSGIVTNLENSSVLASFTKYNGVGLTVNFNKDFTQAEQTNVLSAINGFIADVKAKAAEESVINL